LVNNVDADTARLIDLEPYTTQDFRKDMDRVTAGRSDPALSRVLTQDSNGTIKWLWKNGIRSQLSFNRQAYKVMVASSSGAAWRSKRETIAVISTSNREVDGLFCVGEIARRTILWQLFRWQWIDFRSSLWTESREGNCGGSGEAVSDAVRSKCVVSEGQKPAPLAYTIMDRWSVSYCQCAILCLR
jgi:hypothetical protein